MKTLLRMKTLLQSKYVIVLTLLIALPASPLFGGVVFEVETTYHSGSPRGPESSQMSAEGKNIKMEIASSDGRRKDEVIFRGDRRQMIVVEHRDDAYMVIDSETAAQLGGQAQGHMQQAMKEMEKHLAQLDPKQREAAEKMLKGGLGQMSGQMAGAASAGGGRSPAEFKRTSQRATKQGYPCVRYDVVRDGEKVQELWVTDWSNVKGSKDVMGAFEEMADFFEELMGAFSDSMGGGNFFDGNVAFETFTEIDGFPVVTRDFEGGELESETILESVTERDLDPDAFEPPKGYRLRSMGPQ